MHGSFAALASLAALLSTSASFAVPTSGAIGAAVKAPVDLAIAARAALSATKTGTHRSLVSLPILVRLDHAPTDRDIRALEAVGARRSAKLV